MGELLPIDQMQVALEPVSTTPALMQALANAASSTVDLARFERIWEIYEKVAAREETSNMQAKEVLFDAAMSQAQSKIKAAVADKDNTQTRSKYATYFALDEAVRAHYTEQGFGLTFKFGEVNQDIATVICHITHTSGFSRDYSVPVPVDGKGAKGGDVMTKTHALKSGMTYAMSMLLIMIFNIPINHNPADDDGNKAGAVTITDDQAVEIHKELARCKVSVDGFLRYKKIANITDLPAKDFEHALASIEETRKAREQKA